MQPSGATCEFRCPCASRSQKACLKAACTFACARRCGDASPRTPGPRDRRVGHNFYTGNPTDPRQCLAPDVLVWLGAPDRPFSSWKVWERGAPHLAVEIDSESDARDRPWERKLEAYRHSGVVELVRFDAEDEQSPLRLWDRVEGDLVEREVSKRELEYSDVLGLFSLVEPAPELTSMLRLSRDSAGLDRLLTDEEARHAAEARVRELEAELARRRNGNG